MRSQLYFSFALLSVFLLCACNGKDDGKSKSGAIYEAAVGPHPFGHGTWILDVDSPPQAGICTLSDDKGTLYYTRTNQSINFDTCSLYGDGTGCKLDFTIDFSTASPTLQQVGSPDCPG